MNDPEHTPAVTHREAAAAGAIAGTLLLAFAAGVVFIGIDISDPTKGRRLKPLTGSRWRAKAGTVEKRLQVVAASKP
jgi:hypothetical protein